MSFDFASLKKRTREIIERELGEPAHKVSGNLFYCCPFTGEKTASFCLYDDHFYCFGSCGRRGDAMDFVKYRYGFDTKAAFEYLERQYKVGYTNDNEAIAQYKEQQRLQREAELAEVEAARAQFAQTGLWNTYHQNLTPESRALWNQAGIPDDWQNFWSLGYVDKVSFDKGGHEFAVSPALTIPFVTFTNSRPSQVVGLQYRLLSPEAAHSKYRFHKHEQKHLGSTYWIADPRRHMGEGDLCVVVEGAKKAGVVFSTLYNLSQDRFQVIGIPSMNNSAGVIAALKEYERVVFWLDPEAWIAPPKAPQDWVPWPVRYCKAVGPKARYVRHKLKPDDAILKFDMTAEDVLGIIQANAVLP